MILAYDPDFAWVPSSIKTGPRQPGDTGGKTVLMVAMNGGKGVGMAGGPGDIREGIAPPFREASNRNPGDAVEGAPRGRRRSGCVKTPDGDSALHLAAFGGKLAVVRALVEGGADVTSRTPPVRPRCRSFPSRRLGRRRRPAGAQVDGELPAQPTEVAALLRGLASGDAQARD